MSCLSGAHDNPFFGSAFTTPIVFTIVREPARQSGTGLLYNNTINKLPRGWKVKWQVAKGPRNIPPTGVPQSDRFWKFSPSGQFQSVQMEAKIRVHPLWVPGHDDILKPYPYPDVHKVSSSNQALVQTRNFIFFQVA